MKKLRIMLTTLSILFALSVVAVPVQTVQALERSSRYVGFTTKKHFFDRSSAAALWAAILRLLGW